METQNNPAPAPIDQGPLGPVPQGSAPVPADNPKSTGPLIGVIIIIIVLAIGGFYFLKNAKSGATPPPEEVIESTQTLAPASDELSSIEADLDTTTLDDIDASLDDAGKELGL